MKRRFIYYPEDDTLVLEFAEAEDSAYYDQGHPDLRTRELMGGITVVRDEHTNRTISVTYHMIHNFPFLTRLVGNWAEIENATLMLLRERWGEEGMPAYARSH